MSGTGIQLGFVSGSFPDAPGRLHLVGVDGVEELSRLFEFQLLLTSPDGPLIDAELAALVCDPCAVALGPGSSDVVHGLLADIEHLDGTRYREQRYVARFVPYVSLLAMAPRSAVYQNVTVPELVDQLLTSYGLVRCEHFEFIESRTMKSPKREYIVQYQESDWDFLCRWLEHEGYFYWFHHTRDAAVLMIAHANEDTSTIEAPWQLEFRERNNLATGGAVTVWDFNVVQRRITSRVIAMEYNHRSPNDVLVAVQDVDAKGFGNVFSFGEHFKDLAAGRDIARLRAERFRATQRTVRGVADCARLRVGHRFALQNHHVASYDGDYLVTKIRHRVGYDVAATRSPERADADAPLRPYNAEFEALPAGVQYRPERRTRWPRIHGYLPAHVEADTGGDYAQIDGEGRYKVKLPFDAGTLKGLAASRWVRMAQAYAGAGYGTHYPLHKGTEVLLAHVDGDPDRPVILAAVPNRLTPGPVVAGNATQSVLDTASSIRVELEDLQS
ncbi:MAG: type VI secretion system tip protein VgrG [Deltaproteobacteria bacterium]|nr:type VI secretion system tip protein VgrG [Deltaproteobacteria bacterium]